MALLTSFLFSVKSLCTYMHMCLRGTFDVQSRYLSRNDGTQKEHGYVNSTNERNKALALSNRCKKI
jgi:hypothetical protein